MVTKKKITEQPKADVKKQIEELQKLRKISDVNDQVRIDNQLLELTAEE